MSLQKYKGPDTRHACPGCGELKSFTYYLYKDGNIISPNVGRCNREIKCGYHYSPKQYFSDNSNLLGGKYIPHVKMPKLIHVEAPLSYIPFKIFLSTLESGNNNFINYLSSKLDSKQVQKAITDYYIGTSDRWKGSNIFWQIDEDYNVRTGRIMLFDSVIGKRIKNPESLIDWTHRYYNIAGTKQCFFGQHLLKGNNKTIAIVESEKTAVVGSLFMPKYVWIACGGLGMLSIERCKPLENRKVILFPDLGCYDIWLKKAEVLNRSIKGISVTVSDYLEINSTDEQKADGLDLADFLLSIDPQHKTKSQPIPEKSEKQFDQLKTPKEEEILKTSPLLKVTHKENVINHNELFNFFETIKLSIGPYKLDQATTINDLTTFVQSHVTIIKHNNCNPYFNSYVKRLETLKNQLMECTI